MLNPTDVAELRARIRSSPNLDQFKGLTVAHAKLTAGGTDTVASTQLAPPWIGGMTPPAGIFGTPSVPSCLDGVEAAQRSVPEKRLYTVPHARIIGNTTVLGEAGAIFAPSPAVSEAALKSLTQQNAADRQGFVIEATETGPVATFIARHPGRSILSRALFLHNLEPGNYGSFLFRQLPQILCAANHTSPFDCYVVPDRTPWFREALALAGAAEMPILTIHEVSGDTFASVSLFNGFDAEGFLSADTVEGIQTAAAEASKTRGIPGQTQLYVSRVLGNLSRPDYRVLADEAAIEDLFRSKGFTVVYPETLGLAGQARLFRSAKSIAGPSGSGMLNAMFAAPGTRVLDMESVHVTVRQHAKIYASSSKDYAFLFGTPQPDGTQPAFLRPWSIRDADLAEALAWLMR